MAAGLAAALSAVMGTAPAVADTPAEVKSVAIQGDPVVGATLTAVVVATGDPAPTITYQWARCDAQQPNRCSAIPGATANSYTVTSADLAHPLIVRVTATNTETDSAKSAPTAPVVAAPEPTPGSTPTPDPAPDPTPPPDATPAGTSDPSVSVAAGQTDLVPTAVQAPPLAVPAPLLVRYLQPFPVVRTAGYSVRGGAYITLLRVTAPRGTLVAITCRGRGCPLRRLSHAPGRIHQLERFLRAGVEVTIRVTRRGYIGKYVSFVVRSHASPKRRDACLLPGASRPAACPR